MPNDIQDAIFNAIDNIVQDRVGHLQTDKTITATITQCNNSLTGEYQVNYQGGNIIAYSENGSSYTKNTTVYVLVPEGDFSKRKIILGYAASLQDDNNITFVASALNDYDVVGRNTIKHKTESSFGLHSYLKQDYFSIYRHVDENLEQKEKDEIIKNNLVDVDDFELRSYLKQSESIMIEASFRTNLPREHRNAKTGYYGLKFILAFYDRSIAHDEEEENSDTVSYKYYSYILDTNNMTGNPYAFSSWTDQYNIFPIDVENFHHIESISFFSYGFVNEDNLEKNKEWGDDIWCNNLEIYGLKHIGDTNGDYRLRISTPKGAIFDTLNGEESLDIVATTEYQMMSITDSTMFYWFAADARVINSASEGFMQWGGTGWKHLKTENIGNKPTISIYEKDNKAYENKYLCVAVYKETIILKSYFTIYNRMASQKIEITSNLGVKFSFDRGYPELTCLINGKDEKFDSEGKISDNKYLFYWSKIDEFNQISTFLKTAEEIQQEYDDLHSKFEGELPEGEKRPSYSELKELQDQKALLNGIEFPRGIHGNKIIYPVKNIDNYASFKCSVYIQQEDNNQIFIGSSDILLQNESAADPIDYNILIENGDQVFQYNETGVSPTNDRYENPLQVKPLYCHFYDPAGLEVDASTYSVVWLVPLSSTMVKIPETKFLSLNPANGRLELFVTANSFDPYPMDIVDNFNYQALNNQVTCIVTYDGQQYTKDTRFSFIKVGDNGTNGTDVVAKISPSYNIGNILDEDVLTLEKRKNEYRWNTKQKTTDKVLNFDLYQRGDKVSLNSDPLTGTIERVYWGVAGNRSTVFEKIEGDNAGAAIIPGKSKEAELKTTLQNQIIKGYVTSKISGDATTYYAFYPIPIVHYNSSKLEMHIDKDYTLRQILYNADGRNPLYNKNQGIKLRFENVNEEKNSSDSAKENLNKVLQKLNTNIINIWADDNLTAEEKLKQTTSILQDLKDSFYGTAFTREDKEIVNDYLDSLEESTSQEVRDIINKTINSYDSKKIKIEVLGGIDSSRDSAAFKLMLQKNASKDNKDEVRTDFYGDDCPALGVNRKNELMCYILPEDVYSGLYVNNLVHGQVYAESTDIINDQPDIEFWIPIHMMLNVYGLASLNKWDGNAIEINEDDNYILAPQIGAGLKNVDDNTFTGVVMGVQTTYDGTIYEDTKTDKNPTGSSEKVGLMGYSGGKQSIWLDAVTGKAVFGLTENDSLDNNNRLTEGRIELVPGGISSISRWKIDSRSLYNVISEGGKAGEIGPRYEDAPGKEYIKPGFEDGDNKYADTRIALRSIPHWDSGILLNAQPAYVSIKGHQLYSKDQQNLAKKIDFDDANVVITEGDTFELQFDSNDFSVFTLYRHTNTVDNNKIATIYKNNVGYVVVEEIRREEDGTPIYGENPYSTAIYKTTNKNKDYLQNSENIKSWKINRFYNNNYFLYPERSGVAHWAIRKVHKNTGKGYKVGDNVNVGDIKSEQGEWRRTPIVGINGQGRFYSNALQDAGTSLNIGKVGAFGRRAGDEYYIGASIDVGDNSVEEDKKVSVFKMFTLMDQIDDPEAPLYLTSGQFEHLSELSEYARPISMHGKSIALYSTNQMNASTTTKNYLKISENDDEASLVNNEQSYLKLRTYDKENPEKNGSNISEFRVNNNFNSYIAQKSDFTLIGAVKETLNSTLTQSVDGKVSKTWNNAADITVIKDYDLQIKEQTTNTSGSITTKDKFQIKTNIEDKYMWIGTNTDSNKIANSSVAPIGKKQDWTNGSIYRNALADKSILQISANMNGTPGATEDDGAVSGIASCTPLRFLSRDHVFITSAGSHGIRLDAMPTDDRTLQNGARLHLYPTALESRFDLYGGNDYISNVGIKYGTDDKGNDLITPAIKASPGATTPFLYVDGLGPDKIGMTGWSEDFYPEVKSNGSKGAGILVNEDIWSKGTIWATKGLIVYDNYGDQENNSTVGDIRTYHGKIWAKDNTVGGNDFIFNSNLEGKVTVQRGTNQTENSSSGTEEYTIKTNSVKTFIEDSKNLIGILNEIGKWQLWYDTYFYKWVESKIKSVITTWCSEPGIDGTILATRGWAEGKFAESGHTHDYASSSHTHTVSEPATGGYGFIADAEETPIKGTDQTIYHITKRTTNWSLTTSGPSS